MGERERQKWERKRVRMQECVRERETGVREKERDTGGREKDRTRDRGGTEREKKG